MNTLEELVSVGMTVTKGLGENLNPLYLQDIEDMKPCSGAVVQKGLEKVAVYVDEKGEKHTYNALCPHMGCVVQVSLALLTTETSMLGAAQEKARGLFCYETRMSECSFRVCCMRSEANMISCVCSGTQMKAPLTARAMARILTDTAM